MKLKSIAILICLFSYNLSGQDLKIISLEYETEQTSYQRFEGIITIENTSDTDIVGFFVTTLYISEDAVYDANDRYFSSVGNWGLKANQHKSLTFDAGAAQFGINVNEGDYYIIAVVDSRHKIDETNEDNNYSFSPITILPAKVDYTFSSASKDKIHVAKGDIVNFTYTLSNLEMENVSSLYTTFYLSTDNTLDQDDIKWSSEYNGINWQKNFTNSISLTVPSNLTEEYYYVFAKIENYGQEITLTETNLNNDIVALESFKIIHTERDLSISDIFVMPIDFTHIHIDSKITNTSASGLQGYGSKYYLSEDEILDENDDFFILFPYHNHPSQYLPPNQTQEVSNFAIAHDVREYLPPGRWYLIGHINYDGKINETDYSNNYAVSNQFEIPDYEVSVEVQALTTVDGFFESSDQLTFNVDFKNENYQSVLIYDCQLLDKNGKIILWDFFFSSISIYDSEINENIIWKLDSPLKEGDYTLVIKSDYTTPYVYDFRVDGLFSDLEERLDNKILTLSWESSILDELDNFAIKIYSENFDSTYVSSSSHISFERKSVEHGDYKWTVYTVINGKIYTSEVKSFTIPPISVEVESLSLNTSINDLENAIPFTIVFNNENYSGDLEYEVQISDANDTIVWNTLESIDLGKSTKSGKLNSDNLFSQEIKILLDKPLKRGTYSLSVISDFILANSYDFTVLPAVTSQESFIDSDKLTITWEENFPIDVGSAKIYIYGENYASTYSLSGQDQIIISTNHLEPGVYSWYISVNKDEGVYRSDTANFTIERILSAENDIFKKTLTISPNPADQFILIENEEITQIIISNTQGKEIKKILSSVPTLVTRVDVSDIIEGIYVLQIVKSKDLKVENIKLIINR